MELKFDFYLPEDVLEQLKLAEKQIASYKEVSASNNFSDSHNKVKEILEQTLENIKLGYWYHLWKLKDGTFEIQYSAEFDDWTAYDKSDLDMIESCVLGYRNLIDGLDIIFYLHFNREFFPEYRIADGSSGFLTKEGDRYTWDLSNIKEWHDVGEYSAYLFCKNSNFKIIFALTSDEARKKLPENEEWTLVLGEPIRL